MLGIPMATSPTMSTSLAAFRGTSTSHSDQARSAPAPRPRTSGTAAKRGVPLSGIPDIAVPVETSNGIFLLHGRVRAQKREGRVRPYVDGLVGFNYLITTTSVHADTSCSGGGCDSDDTDSMTNLDDLVLSAGGGGGVQIGFGQVPHRVRLESIRAVSLRWRGQVSGRGLDSLESPINSLTRRSLTDMLLVYVGVAFGR